MKNPDKRNGDDDDMMMMAVITNIVDIAKCQSLLQALSPCYNPIWLVLLFPILQMKKLRLREVPAFLL